MQSQGQHGILKSQVEDICLGSLLEDNLKSRGWPVRVCAQYKLFLAPPNVENYNRYNICCVSQSISVYHQPTLVQFLCDIADASHRPASILNNVVVTHLFGALGDNIPKPMHDQFEKNFIIALIKSNTIDIHSKSKVIPVAPFIDVFRSWSKNDYVDIKHLRL